MINSPKSDNGPPPEGGELQDRRLFLRGMGKWSGAAITAAIAGTWLATEQHASAWINRRVGGGWINGGGGGGWINRRGGGGWINR